MEKLSKDFIPDSLTDSEKKVWERIYPYLLELEIINIFNWGLLERYCIVSIQAENLIRNKPTMATAIREFSKELRALEKQLCLTPKDYDRLRKDRLYIQALEAKQNKNKMETIDKYKESFFQ